MSPAVAGSGLVGQVGLTCAQSAAATSVPLDVEARPLNTHVGPAPRIEDTVLGVTLGVDVRLTSMATSWVVLVAPAIAIENTVNESGLLLLLLQKR